MKIRKATVSLVILICICSLLLQPCSAANLGQFGHWDCDANQFYYLESARNNELVTYKTEIGNDLANSLYRYTMYNGVSSAVVAWSNVNTGVSIDAYASSQSSDTDLVFYIGTRDEMEDIVPTGSVVDAEAIGYTWRGTGIGTPVHYASFGQKTIDIYEVPEDQGIYIFSWDTQLNTYQMATVFTHEMGHALGWEGHYTGTNDLMCTNQTTMTNWGTQYIYPSYADVAHLYQVYNNPNL